jgi:hypothetical protein
MATYGIPAFQATMSSSYKSSASQWQSATPRRTKWYEIVAGAVQNPVATDTQIQLDVSRFTTTTGLAGTAFTPNPTDPADAACQAVVAINLTTDPVVTANSSVMNFGLNQRGTTRWIAAQESQFLIVAATAQAGFNCRQLSANYNTSIATQITFME